MKTQQLKSQVLGTSLLFLLGCGLITSQETNDGWETMFNGNDLNGWTTKVHHYEVGDNYADTFRAEDDMVKVRYDKDEGEFNNRYSHLYYDKPFSDFHFTVQSAFFRQITYFFYVLAF